MRRLPVAIAVIAGMLASAAPASAGTICLAGTTATFEAADVALFCGGAPAASEVNTLTVSRDAAGNVVVTDVNPVADGDGPLGCDVSGNTATCPGALSFQGSLGGDSDTLTLQGAVGSGGLGTTGGDGNDTFTGGPLADTFDGGAGPDTIQGGDGNDVLSGGPDGDTISGGAGDDQLDGFIGGCGSSGGSDQLNGEGGDDFLCAGNGPTGGVDNDVVNGGDGIDRASYSGRTNGVSASLEGAANDGEAGESDNVGPDVEVLVGGSGNDALTGNDGPNTLDGAAGADTLNGNGGDDSLIDNGGDSASDTLNGGDGDDSLAAGRGPDVYSGGPGVDLLLDYAGRSVPVTVTLDGTADDGQAGEGDNAGNDIEDVIGGTAGDTITATGADNELTGGAGNDTLNGGDGNDGLTGGAGADVIDGGDGRDHIDGSGGADNLKARDGKTDRVECGGGSDKTELDGRDDFTGDCEERDIAPPGQVAIGTVQVTRSGFLVVRLTCPVTERTCAGTLSGKTLRRIGRVFVKLGQVGYRLREGQTLAIKAKIPAGSKKPLKRARRVKIRVIVTNVNNDTGVKTTSTKTATVVTRGL